MKRIKDFLSTEVFTITIRHRDTNTEMHQIHITWKQVLTAEVILALIISLFIN